MAISLYFGLPGSGKTTLLAREAYRHIKAGGKVCGNVDLAVSGYRRIDDADVGKYDLTGYLILIDEGTLFADSRDFKRRDERYTAMIRFFLLHRHYHCDIIVYTQQWDGLDKRIRVITDRVYYVYKGVLTGRLFTRYYRVPYGIIIPNPKKAAGGDHLGEIVQGYCKPPLLRRIFGGWMFRPRWYRYFDSWDAPKLPALPDR